MRCHMHTEDGERFFLPGCMGGAVYGRRGCTCPHYEKSTDQRDLMGPHRGIQVKIIELHGTMGGAQWKIEREPFWMEVSPLMAVQARASYDAFCSKTKPKAVEGVSQLRSGTCLNS